MVVLDREPLNLAKFQGCLQETPPRLNKFPQALSEAVRCQSQHAQTETGLSSSRYTPIE
jgi:hypothetical protein